MSCYFFLYEKKKKEKTSLFECLKIFRSRALLCHASIFEGAPLDVAGVTDRTAPFSSNAPTLFHLSCIIKCAARSLEPEHFQSDSHIAAARTLKTLAKSNIGDTLLFLFDFKCNIERREWLADS